jgi:hypothetical protein
MEPDKTIEKARNPLGLTPFLKDGKILPMLEELMVLLESPSPHSLA